ncbi:MAG: hypothetical protein WAQ98_22415 [Blastocatellia bacterium]
MSATNNVSNLFDFGIYSSPKLTKSEEKLIDGKLKDGDEVFYYCAKCHRVGRTEVKYYSAGKVCNSCQVKRHDEKDEKELISEYASDIRRVAKDLGRVPTSTEYNQLGRYPLSRLGQVFQKSWKEILSSLGYYTGKKEVSCQEVATHLRHISQELNKLPTLKEYQELGKIDVGAIKRATKTDNWTEVLAKVFHLPTEIVDQVINLSHQYYQEQLSKIKTIAEKLNRVPSAKEAAKYGVNVDLISKRLGKNWIEILKLAGVIDNATDISSIINITNIAIDKSNNSNNYNPKSLNKIEATNNPSLNSSLNSNLNSNLKYFCKKIIRDEEMLADLNRVAKELGYYPDKLKYTQLGAYSANNLMYRFNLSWVGIIDLAKGRELVIPTKQTIRRAKTCLHQTILEYFSIPTGTRR